MTETADRPLPSERIDAVAERLKAEAPAPARKRSKAPVYMVLRRDDNDPAKLELAGDEIAASSRREAIKAACEGCEDAYAQGTFVVILADQWTELRRAVTRREVVDEEWS